MKISTFHTIATSAIAIMLSLPLCSIAQEEKEVSSFYICLEFPTKGARGITLNDIVFYNNGKRVYMDSNVVPWGQAKGVGATDTWTALLDGNPNTFISGNYAKRWNTLPIKTGIKATSVLIRTRAPSSLKGVIFSLRKANWKPVYELDLAELSKYRQSTAFMISLSSGKLKPLSKDPHTKFAVHKHKVFNPIPYIDGTSVPLNDRAAMERILNVTAQHGGPGTSSKHVSNTWKYDKDALILDSGSGRLKFKDRYLEPGQIISISVDMGLRPNPGTWHYLELSLGKYKYTFRQFMNFFDAKGRRCQVEGNKPPHGGWPLDFTLSVERGKGAKSNTLTWRMHGMQWGRQGIDTIKEGLPKRLPIQFYLRNHPFWGWKPNSRILSWRITHLIHGKAKGNYPQLTNTAYKFTMPQATKYTYSSIRSQAKKRGVKLPELRLKRLYGKWSQEELDVAKTLLKHVQPPKANNNNALVFSGWQEMNGLYLLLDLTNDPELLELLVKWTDSVIEWRNGGPHYTINTLPSELWNEPPNTITPLPQWPGYFQGEVNGKHTVGMGTGGCGFILYLPDYITKHPEIWNKPCPIKKGKTWLQVAKYYAGLCEGWLDKTTYRFYVDPETSQIHSAWNRFTQVVEATNRLSNIHERLADHPDFYDSQHKAKHDRVVKAFCQYFMDQNQNLRVYAGKDATGKAKVLIDFRYAPRWMGWGGSSEDLGHGSIETHTLGELYVTNASPKFINRAFMHKYANTLKQKIYKGRDKSGKQMFAHNVRGDKFSRSTLRHVYLWPCVVDPDVYDMFVKQIATADRELLFSYAHLMWLREYLYNQGVRGPGEANRLTPKVSIAVGSKSFDPKSGRMTVTLTAKARGKNGARIERLEWDFDSDGKTDATGTQVTHTFSRIGPFKTQFPVPVQRKYGPKPYVQKREDVHQVVLLATDSKGRQASRDLGIVIPKSK